MPASESAGRPHAHEPERFESSWRENISAEAWGAASDVRRQQRHSHGVRRESSVRAGGTRWLAAHLHEDPFERCIALRRRACERVELLPGSHDEPHGPSTAARTLPIPRTLLLGRGGGGSHRHLTQCRRAPRPRGSRQQRAAGRQRSIRAATRLVARTKERVRSERHRHTRKGDGKGCASAPRANAARTARRRRSPPATATPLGAPPPPPLAIARTVASAALGAPPTKARTRPDAHKTRCVIVLSGSIGVGPFVRARPGRDPGLTRVCGLSRDAPTHHHLSSPTMDPGISWRSQPLCLAGWLAGWQLARLIKRAD